MKRKLSGLLALILAFGTTFGMTACGGAGAAPDTPDDLHIFYWNSGQGREWLDKTIAAFELKYPQVKVYKDFSENNATWRDELPSGASINPIDLYINSMPEMLNYTDYLEPLDEVMNYQDNGTKLVDKFDKDLMDLLRGQDGKLYGSYWGGGMCGILYNKTVFDQYDELSIPRTTDELADLAQNILEVKKDSKGNSIYTPYIFPGNADYWAYCYIPWAAQYGGMEELNKFWNPTEPGSSTVDKSVFTSEARRVALMTLEEVAYGYTYSSSNEKTHTAAQTLFLNGTGLMMPNGNWVENEMRNTETEIEFEFMKLPVISALGEKLGFDDDADFAEVVSYVDSADYINSKDSATLTIDEDSTDYDASVITGLDRATIDRVAEARSIVYTEGTSNKVAIPKYATAKEWAKKFIQFMNTEEGLKYYWETLQGPMLAKITAEQNINTWTPFAQNVMGMLENSTFVYRSKGHPFFYINALEFYPEYPQTYLFPADEDDRVDAATFWQEKCLDKYDADWNLWVEYYQNSLTK